MSPLTLAELRLRQAMLVHDAERLRQQWRTAIPTEPRTMSMGRRVKAAQERADEYMRIIQAAEAMT